MTLHLSDFLAYNNYISEIAGLERPKETTTMFYFNCITTTIDLKVGDILLGQSGTSTCDESVIAITPQIDGLSAIVTLLQTTGADKALVYNVRMPLDERVAIARPEYLTDNVNFFATEDSRFDVIPILAIYNEVSLGRVEGVVKLKVEVGQNASTDQEFEFSFWKSFDGRVEITINRVHADDDKPSVAHMLLLPSKVTA